jgi:hypothetical protein
MHPTEAFLIATTTLVDLPDAHLFPRFPYSAIVGPQER